jgi:hypothetical protein
VSAHELKRCLYHLARAVIVIEDVEGVATSRMGLELHMRTELFGSSYEGVDRVVDARPVEASLGDEQGAELPAPALEVRDRGVLDEFGSRGFDSGPSLIDAEVHRSMEGDLGVVASRS